MPDLTDPPDWQKRNQGLAKNGFTRAATGGKIIEPPKPAPAKTHDMRGPGGDAARSQAKEQVAIARAKQIEKQKPVEKEKEVGRASDKVPAVVRAEKLAKEFNNAAKYKGHER